MSLSESGANKKNVEKFIDLGSEVAIILLINFVIVLIAAGSQSLIVGSAIWWLLGWPATKHHLHTFNRINKGA